MGRAGSAPANAGRQEILRACHSADTGTAAASRRPASADWNASRYLALRWTVEGGREWAPGLVSPTPRSDDAPRHHVESASQIEEALREELSGTARGGSPGLLLSGGIDSAILAALLPAGTRAYTIRFEAEGALDESPGAAAFARDHRLAHRVVTVSWADHLREMDALMLRKRAPLHPVEVGLFQAARAAQQDGVDRLIVGNGADSNFGGLDRLLSRDWGFDAFVHRYTFTDPETVLANPVSVRSVFAPYRIHKRGLHKRGLHKKGRDESGRGEGVDVLGFLNQVHGPGITQAFENALGAGGCRAVTPYESLRLAGSLDLERIRRGESKYLLRELFRRLHPGAEVPEKVAFARPMDRWLGRWTGVRRPEIRDDLDPATLTGEQRWQVLCLARFFELCEEAG